MMPEHELLFIQREHVYFIFILVFFVAVDSVEIR